MSTRSTTTAATLSLLENAPHTFNQGSDLSMPVMVPAATVAAAMRNAISGGDSADVPVATAVAPSTEPEAAVPVAVVATPSVATTGAASAAPSTASTTLVEPTAPVPASSTTLDAPGSPLPALVATATDTTSTPLLCDASGAPPVGSLAPAVAKTADEKKNVLQKVYYKALKPYFRGKGPNSTRFWKKWVPLVECDPTTDSIDVDKLYAMLVKVYWPTLSMDEVVSRINWSGNDTARFAHVMMDPEMRPVLQRLLQGSSRQELDSNVRTADNWNLMAARFKDGSIVYTHVDPHEPELASLDPNNPAKWDWGGLKLMQVWRGVRAEMTAIHVKYTQSGQNGELSFWYFCDGRTPMFYFHRLWKDQPMYGALCRLIPGGREEGAGSPPSSSSNSAAAAGAGSMMSPSSRGRRRRSSPSTPPTARGMTEEEASLVRKKAKLVDSQLVENRLRLLQSKLNAAELCVSSWSAEYNDEYHRMQSVCGKLRTAIMDLCAEDL